MSLIEDINKSNQNPGIIRRLVMRVLHKYSDYDLFGVSLMSLEGEITEIEEELDKLEKKYQKQITNLEERVNKLKTVKLLVSHEDESNYEKEI